MIHSEDELALAQSTGGTLIRSYGLYWSRNAVNWNSNPQELKGDRRHYRVTTKNATKKAKSCNVWNVRGIYALYSDFKLIYVGMAGSAEGIGTRLKAHTEKPRLSGRWDSFSWFGIDGFNDDGSPIRYREQTASAEILVRSFELITMLVADPPLNRSQGRFKGAEAIVQSAKDAGPSLSDLESLLKDLLTALREQ